MSEPSDNRFTRALLGAALLLTVVGAAGGVGWVLRGEMQQQPPPPKPEMPSKNSQPKEKLERKPPQVNFETKVRTLLSQAEAARHSQELGHRALALKDLRAAASLSTPLELRQQLRNEAIASLAISLDLSPAKKWEGWPAGSAHFDFDGQLQVFARSDRRGNVSVRRVADDKEISRIVEGKGETWVRLSPDGRFLLTHYRDSLKVWQLGKSKPAVALERQGHAYDFHPAKPLLAIGVKDGSLEVIDLVEGKSRHFQAESKIDALAWHPSANQIALSSSEGIKILDLDSDHAVAALEAHAAPGLRSLAWHPQGRLLALAGMDHRVQLWNVQDEQKVLVLAGQPRQETRVAFNHKGDVLATTAEDGNLRLWDPRTGRQLKRLAWGSNEVPRFSTDDRVLAARMNENSAQMWEITAAEEYRMLAREATPEESACYAAAVGLDGRLLAAAMDDGVSLWDLKTTAYLGLLEAGTTYSVAFEHSGAAGLLTSGPTGVKRWPVRLELATGRLRMGPPEELSLAGNQFQIGVSRDDHFVAQAAGAAGGHVLWQNPKKSVDLAPHPDVRYVAVSSDGLWVATSTEHGVGVKIWEAQSGKLVQELLPRASGFTVEFSADGKWLATQSPTVQLWKVGTWEKAISIPGTQFGFAPDAKVIAVESGLGVVHLYDPANGQEVARLPNPQHDAAHRIVFSPDGSQLVTLGSDSYYLHVWDLRLIRRQLADMKLDWDMSPYPAPGPSWASGPLQLEVNN